MEFIMNWRWLIATVIVFGGIAIITAFARRRSWRSMTAAKRARQWLKQENLWRNWFAFPVVMIGIILIITGIVLLVFPQSLVILGTPIRPWLLVFFALTVWLFSRKENIEPDQWGVKKFFGRIVQDFGEGPALVPPGLFTLQKIPTLQFSIQIGEQETKPTLQLLSGVVSQEALQQCHDSLNDVLEVNFAHPNEARWTIKKEEEDALKSGDKTVRENMEAEVKERKKKYENDPANARLTAQMRVTFLVRIDETKIKDFVRNIKSPDRAILELNELARAVVGRWCGKRTAAFVSTNMGLLGREILNNAEDLVGEKRATVKRATGDDRRVNPKSWGLDILKTEVHALDLPDSVKEAVAGFSVKIASADGEKYELIRKGEGTADAREQLGIAEAAAVRAMNAELATDAGKFARAMEAAEKMVQAGNVVFSGDNPVAVAAAQIKAAFDAYQPPKAPPQPAPQTRPPRGGTP